MTQQTFFNTPYGRPILIRIEKENEIINFFFKKEHIQWFYDIPIFEWNKNYPYWQDHMKNKRCFTEEMKIFIDKNIK